MDKYDYLLASKTASAILRSLGFTHLHRARLNAYLKTDNLSQAYYLRPDRSEYIVLKPDYDTTGTILYGVHVLYRDIQEKKCIDTDLIGSDITKIQANLKSLLLRAKARCLDRS